MTLGNESYTLPKSAENIILKHIYLLGLDGGKIYCDISVSGFKCNIICKTYIVFMSLTCQLFIMNICDIGGAAYLWVSTHLQPIVVIVQYVLYLLIKTCLANSTNRLELSWLNRNVTCFVAAVIAFWDMFHMLYKYNKPSSGELTCACDCGKLL